MNNGLFFPRLNRQEIDNYYKTNNEFYATYNCQKNQVNISKDCQNRCVYCDAHVDECGGEPFSLDHFRPLNVFGDKFNGILKIHPFNLHLSCQKCNVLKTNDWKGCLETQDGDTFIERKGYIDRFKEDASDYLKVDNEGYVRCTNDNGPAEYMIGKLLLNRTNRVYIRKLREVKNKAEVVQSMLTKKQQSLVKKWENNELTKDQFTKEFNSITELFSKFQKLELLKF